MGLKRSALRAIPHCTMFAFLVAVALISSTSAFREALPAGEEGWVSLFEGASLKGWESDSDAWVVRDGLLTGDRGTILNRWCWVDFELEIHFRGEGDLLFRVGSGQMGHIGYEQPGYRYDLAKGEMRTGRGDLVAAATTKRSGSGSWRTVTLEARRGELSVREEGELLIQASEGSSPLKGRIGFAVEKGRLEIEFVRVRRLEGKSRENVPADNAYCYVCHMNFEYDDDLVTAHEEADIGCADCHGSSLEHRSDEDNVTPPEIIFRRPQVDPKCMECHERHEEQGQRGEEAGEGRVCTDCHGSHRLP